MKPNSTEWKEIWYSKFRNAMDVYNEALYSREQLNKRVGAVSFHVNNKGVIVSSKRGSKGLTSMIKFDFSGKVVGASILNENYSNKTQVTLNKFGQIITTKVLNDSYTDMPISSKRMDKINNALKLFNESISACPEDEGNNASIIRKAIPHKWIGKLYAYCRLYEEAIKHYRLAIDLWPDNKENNSILELIDILEVLMKEGTYLVVKKQN